MSSSMSLNAALDYARKGWPIIPCNPGNKHPYTPNGHKDATTNTDQIVAWFSRYPSAMIGVPTGSASGIWVLDIDLKDEANGAHELRALEHENGVLPPTMVASTPSGGMHYYFKHEDGIRNRAHFAPGIDVRGEGGYVIVPGSVRHDGCFYEWKNEDAVVAVAPDWLKTKVTKPVLKEPVASKVGHTNGRYVDAAVANELAKLVGTRTNRNNQLNDSAFAIGQLVATGAVSREEAATRLYGAAQTNGYVGKDGEAEARATIKSGLDAGERQPRDIPESNVDGLPEPDPDFSIKMWIERILGRSANDKASKAGAVKASAFALRDGSELPRRKWLFGNHLFRKFISSTVGAGGGGKSSLVIVEAISMASGVALLGNAPPEPLSVWYVNLEDPIDEIERRFVAAAKHHEVTAAMLAGRLYVDSGREQQFVVLKQDRQGTLVVEPVVKSIIQEMREKGIDVLIVDPFISTHEVNENDNSEIQRVAAQFVRIAHEANVAVELVHHVSKGSPDGKEVTADSARGASALKDKARSMRTINGMTLEEAKKAGVDANERFSYFRVNSGKANLAKRTGHSDWRRIISVDLGNGTKWTPGDSVGVVEQWQWPAETSAADELTPDQLAEIESCIAQANHAENSQSDDWAGRVFAQVLGLDAEDRDDIRKIERIMKAMVKQGHFVVVRRQDRSKGRERPMFEVAPTPHRESGGVGMTVH